jgi:hypothetical protein
MEKVEDRLYALIERSALRGYTIKSMRVTYTHNLKKVTVRMRVEPYPLYDERWGESRGTLNGSLVKLEEIIDSFPVL